MQNTLVQQIEADPEGTHKCPGCGKDTPNERYITLKTVLCTGCTEQPKKLYGIMEYSEKAVGILVTTEDEATFRELKKPANKRR